MSTATGRQLASSSLDDGCPQGRHFCAGPCDKQAALSLECYHDISQLTTALLAMQTDKQPFFFRAAGPLIAVSVVTAAWYEVNARHLHPRHLQLTTLSERPRLPSAFNKETHL